MIRNSAGGSAVRDTAKLIETLKKVGVIKTKKRRARRSLAKDEIRQDSDMGPGFAVSAPPQFGASPQQQDYNVQRIEDIQRQSGNQITLLKNEIQKLKAGEQQSRFMPRQYIKNDDVSSLKVEQLPSAPQRGQPYLDVNEYEGNNSGPQPDQGSAKAGTIDFDRFGKGIFVGDEEETAIDTNPPEPDTAPPDIKERPRYKGGLKPEDFVQMQDIEAIKVKDGGDFTDILERMAKMGIDVTGLKNIEGGKALKGKVTTAREELKQKLREFIK